MGERCKVKASVPSIDVIGDWASAAAKIPFQLVSWSERSRRFGAALSDIGRQVMRRWRHENLGPRSYRTLAPVAADTITLQGPAAVRVEVGGVRDYDQLQRLIRRDRLSDRPA